MNKGKIIRWGIMGTGFIAHNFAEGLKFVPNSKLVAVGSRTESQADKFSRCFGTLCVYSNYEALVSDSNIDVIYIATPAALHREHCLLALEHGKSVLCEKPFAMNADQAKEIIEVARKKRLFCMEAMWMRFIPLMKKVHTMVKDGAVGEVRIIKADLGFPYFYDPDDRHFNPSLGGGAMLDLGIYPLSLATWLLGSPTSINSEATLAESGVDEQSAAILNYSNGAKAIISANLRCQSSNEAYIIGLEGYIRIQAPLYRPHKMTYVRVPQPRKKSSPEYTPGILSRIKNFPLLQKSLLRIDGLLGPIIKATEKSTVISFNGNGYNYEAEEVADCLLSSQTESTVMPLEETINILGFLDQMRDRWGNRA